MNVKILIKLLKILIKLVKIYGKNEVLDEFLKSSNEILNSWGHDFNKVILCYFNNIMNSCVQLLNLCNGIIQSWNEIMNSCVEILNFMRRRNILMCLTLDYMWWTHQIMRWMLYVFFNINVWKNGKLMKINRKTKFVEW